MSPMISAESVPRRGRVVYVLCDARTGWHQWLLCFPKNTKYISYSVAKADVACILGVLHENVEDVTGEQGVRFRGWVMGVERALNRGSMQVH